MNLHSVDLALAFFPRIVGCDRDAWRSTCRPNA